MYFPHGTNVMIVLPGPGKDQTFVAKMLLPYFLFFSRRLRRREKKGLLIIASFATNVWSLCDHHSG